MNGNDREQVIAARPTDSQTQLLGEGYTIMKLENDTQMSVAIQKPRKEDEILRDALAELDTYPSAAAEAIYCKPTGRLGKCPSCGADTFYKPACPRCNKLVPETYAENLSIRTAESLANRWGNNAYGVEYAEETEAFGIVAAVFLDYETNVRRVIQRRVSKFYKKRGSTQVVQMMPDKFDLKVAADSSRALREVILRSLPGGLKREYYLKAYSMLGKSGDIKARTQKMLAEFSRFGVTMEMLETLQGKSLAEFSQDDVTRLVGVYNTIRDGDCTVADIFQGDGKAEEKPDLKVAGGAPTATRPNAEPTPEKLGDWTCQDCGQTFDNPVPCHKGKNKGKSHCPDLECGSFNIIRTELLGIPEPDPSITEPDVEPEPSDPTTAEPAEPATGPAGDAIESPPAGSPPPPTDDPMFQCLNKGHKFPLSQARPSGGTQWGLCPLCLTKKIEPLGG